MILLCLLLCIHAGAIGHQSDDPAGICEPEEGFHYGRGCDDVISVRLA